MNAEETGGRVNPDAGIDCSAPSMGRAVSSGTGGTRRRNRRRHGGGQLVAGRRNIQAPPPDGVGSLAGFTRLTRIVEAADQTGDEPPLVVDGQRDAAADVRVPGGVGPGPRRADHGLRRQARRRAAHRPRRGGHVRTREQGRRCTQSAVSVSAGRESARITRPGIPASVGSAAFRWPARAPGPGVGEVRQAARDRRDRDEGQPAVGTGRRALLYLAVLEHDRHQPGRRSRSAGAVGDGAADGVYRQGRSGWSISMAGN